MKARTPKKRAARDVAAVRRFWTLDASDRRMVRDMIRALASTPMKKGGAR